MATQTAETKPHSKTTAPLPFTPGAAEELGLPATEGYTDEELESIAATKPHDPMGPKGASQHHVMLLFAVNPELWFTFPQVLKKFPGLAVNTLRQIIKRMLNATPAQLIKKELCNCREADGSYCLYKFNPVVYAALRRV
jgi:hypothetical protein